MVQHDPSAAVGKTGQAPRKAEQTASKAAQPARKVGPVAAKAGPPAIKVGTLKGGGAAATGAIRGRMRGAAKAAAVRRTVLPVWVAPALMALVAVLFILWGTAHTQGYTYASASWIGQHGWSDYDEGVYMVSARLLNQGFAPFTQVFSSQPPLFLAGLALFLNIFQDTLSAGYLFSLCCGLMALAGVAWLCWETVGRWTALLAVIVLALSPGFVIAAHAVEAEAPMMGFTSLSVAAAARYARVRNRLWLVIASLLLAAATLSKLLPVAAGPIVVAIGFAVFAEQEQRWRRLLGDLVVALCFAGAPILIAFLLFSPAQQWDQVISFHLRTETIPNLADPGWQTYLTFLGWDPGLLALAVAGFAAVVMLRRPLCLVQISWLLCTVLPLSPRYYPLFVHHLTALLPPLAAVAGGTFAVMDHPRSPRRRRLPAAALLLVGLISYAIWLPATADHLAHTYVPDTDPTKAARVTWLEQNSGPDEMVVTDYQVLAEAAGRLVPPALSDTSIVRWRSGYLPLSLLEQSTADPRVRAVLLMRQLMYIPAYVQWLQQHFHQVQEPQLGGALTFLRY